MDFEEIKEQWEELENWKKLLVVVFFSGIIIYIGYTFLIEEKLSKVKILESEISKLEKDINYLKRYATEEKIKKLNEKIKSIQTQISQKEKELNLYKKYIPDKPFTEKILVDISKIASKSGMQLESFDIKGKNIVYAIYKKDINRVIFKNNLSNNENGVKLNRVNFEIKSSGSIKSLYRFIKFLARTKRIILLDEISIKKIKGNLAFDIKFSSYYMED